jgi:hypothetical protein
MREMNISDGAGWGGCGSTSTHQKVYTARKKTTQRLAWKRYEKRRGRRKLIAVTMIIIPV